MKFFEFTNYEYYGLIIADDKEKAIHGYNESIAEITDEEKDIEPIEISLEEALERYKKGLIEDCDTIEDKEKDFYKNIDNFKNYISKGKEPYLVLLIDGSLI